MRRWRMALYPCLLYCFHCADDEMAARLREAAVSGASVSENAKKSNRRIETVSVREAARTGSASTMKAIDVSASGMSSADEQYQIHATAQLHKYAATSESFVLTTSRTQSCDHSRVHPSDADIDIRYLDRVFSPLICDGVWHQFQLPKSESKEQGIKLIRNGALRNKMQEQKAKIQHDN
eukprot:SAG31_NODE_4480_length_3200_cov_1.900355_1_plen_179_part_00